jgi:hypothetical protein
VKEAQIRDDMIRVGHQAGASLRQLAEVSQLEDADGHRRLDWRSKRARSQAFRCAIDPLVTGARARDYRSPLPDCAQPVDMSFVRAVGSPIPQRCSGSTLLGSIAAVSATGEN